VIEGRELDLGDLTVMISARPLEEGGILLVLSDVTDVRRLETVRRDFVANVSHELKTPLTAIAGYAETLAAEAADKQAKQFAETIVENARRMQRLVDDLLDLSRIESGAWAPEPKPLRVQAAALEAWGPFEDRARERRIQLETTTNSDTIQGDPEALRQIFTNLFDNALRHTPAGGRVRVATERAGTNMLVRVSDTGTGIPADHLPRIFERFYRVDPGRSRQEGGTGLGLAIVKHLVEAHGGHVDAVSELGRGTTIVLSFPFVTES
jgi:signal transduction histidine kinase